QAAGVAHMGAHALGAAAYAARAVERAHPDATDARASDARAAEVRWQLAHLSPEAAAALRTLPPLGTDTAGPLGPGLLSSGALGEVILEIQAHLST
ncbi:putative immunity protein, partial [Microbacterium sp. H6]